MKHTYQLRKKTANLSIDGFDRHPKSYVLERFGVVQEESATKVIIRTGQQ